MITKRLFFTIILVVAPNLSYALGERLHTYELTFKQAAIWDHGNSFYIRTDLKELDGRPVKFVWGGFFEQGNKFVGEIKVDQFESGEAVYTAEALLVSESPQRTFLIRVFNPNQTVIKEFIIRKADKE